MQTDTLNAAPAQQPMPTPPALSKLDRLERWRDFYFSHRDRADRVWVATLWGNPERLRWFMRQRMDTLLAAGAVVKMDGRDLLIDPVVMRQVVSSMMNLADERAEACA